MNDTDKKLDKIINEPDIENATTLFGEFTRAVIQRTKEMFPDAWDFLTHLFGGQDWLLLFTVILTITVLVDFIFRGVLGLLNAYLDNRKQRFLITITTALKAPLSFYIWLSGSVLAINTVIANQKVFDEVMPYINGFKATLAVIAVAWFAIRWVDRFEVYLNRLERKSDRLDPVTREALFKVFKLTVFVITGLFVLSSLGFDLAGLIAFGGIGGIMVGFAAKDFLSNVIGGLMLYLDKPFATGDWIRSPDKNVEGIVESIGWRMTVVRTFDKRPLYIPNGTFSSISIENPSRMTNRRIKEHVGLRYVDVDKLEKVAAEIKHMLDNHDEIDQSQPTIVNFDVFNSSSLDIFINTYTKTTVWVKYHEVKQDILLKITDIVLGNEAEFAFPSRSLYWEQPSIDPDRIVYENAVSESNDRPQPPHSESNEKRTASSNGSQAKAGDSTHS